MKLRTTITAGAAIVALSCMLAGCNREDTESTVGAGKKNIGRYAAEPHQPLLRCMKKALKTMQRHRA
ncbi:Uncharacterised protein [Klebsiella aerogenes]|nr:Uncharacterised protein [Klebsiella aerogenes]